MVGGLVSRAVFTRYDRNAQAQSSQLTPRSRMLGYRVETAGEAPPSVASRISNLSGRGARIAPNSTGSAWCFVVDDPQRPDHRACGTTQTARGLPNRYYADSGGLASYGPDFYDLYRRAAGYVDRVLKGEKPADLPVQAPDKYELVINQKSVEALSLTMPPMLLARADEVIE
jgi:hypothetical protein